MTTERPWASANSSPTSTPPSGLIELTDTEIGFWPVCSRSSTPGVPTNLHTKTFRSDSGAVVVVVVPSSPPVADARGWAHAASAPSMKIAISFRFRSLDLA
jgi:hypothetical protein